MKLRIFNAIILTASAGLIYWFGGQGIVHKCVRSWGCAFIVCLMLRLWEDKASWLIWLLTFGMAFASMTTYYKWGGQDDVYLYNWILTGIAYGLVAAPIVFVTDNWEGYWRRTALLMMTIWLFSDSGVVSGVMWQEIGRGVLYVGTLPMLKRKGGGK